MKNNQKCVRLSDKTLDYIEAWDGNGFNQKLENMVEHFSEYEKKLKKRVSELESREKQLTDSIKKLGTMERTLRTVKSYIDNAAMTVDAAAK